MKPKILNDLTNIFAKLAGSHDYDPKVRYDTALEYYANQVPVLPKPGVGDNGKVPMANSSGAYALGVPAAEVTPAAIVSATGEMNSTQKGQTRANLDVVEKTNPEFVGAISITGYGETHDQVYAELDTPVPERPPVLMLAESETDYPIIVRGISTPNSANDAANKSYVDALKPVVTNVAGSTPIIALCEDNHIYECGELTSLTITAFDNPGKFWIWFTSGATPTTITGIDNFTPEANKKYRVFVENGYATFDAWSYTPTP